MSTFMGAAWVDLAPGSDVAAALNALRHGEPRDTPANLSAWVVETAAGPRVELYTDGEGYEELAPLVANFLRNTPGAHALVALDHDEYGAEHLVLDAPGGQLRRVHHVFVYPRDEDTDEPYMDAEPTLTEVPAAGPSESSAPGALVDGPRARAAAAGLYGVAAERVEKATAEAALAHRELQIIGGPFEAWLDAFGLVWIGESGSTEIPLRS